MTLPRVCFRVFLLTVSVFALFGLKRMKAEIVYLVEILGNVFSGAVE